ncbi:unnamed protein product [Cuscuta campestris]|uniref:Transmembrane protein n=1 Tax=Cuscuta campestris TaxID=132261 RepID=A0A484NHW7_9ASTE|nr:unnamed protein product [Cuscuta campestris]
MALSLLLFTLWLAAGRDNLAGGESLCPLCDSSLTASRLCPFTDMPVNVQRRNSSSAAVWVTGDGRAEDELLVMRHTEEASSSSPFFAGEPVEEGDRAQDRSLRRDDAESREEMTTGWQEVEGEDDASPSSSSSSSSSSFFTVVSVSGGGEANVEEELRWIPIYEELNGEMVELARFPLQREAGYFSFATTVNDASPHPIEPGMAL